MERYGDKMEKKAVQTTCTSVFKSGENTALKSRFTQKWIALINQIEKNKRITAGKR